LTSEQENLLYDEMEKVEERLAQLLTDLGILAAELPDLVEMADEVKNPAGDDLKFVKDVREAQKCQKTLKDIEVTNMN
jgi:hypothetical protein